MSDNPEIGASLGLDIRDYNRNMQRAIRDADQADDALDALVKAANDAEKALNDIGGTVDVKLNTDFGSLLDADRTLQSLDTTVSPVVDVTVANDATVRSLLDSFSEKQTATVDVKVDDTELKSVSRKVDNLDSETVDTKVNADTSELDVVKSQLETLRNLAVIDIVMNLPGNLPTVADVPLLGTILEADKASRRIVSNLGDMGAQNADLYRQGAQDVFTSNFGADQIEAAEAYASIVRTTSNDMGDLTRTGEDFTTITQRAMTVAALSGEDLSRVLRAADVLVATELAPDFETAFDQITVGIQNGLNASDDLFDTITEYSVQFQDLGFTADEFFSTLAGGFDAGAFNTDFVADLIKEANIRAQAALAGEGAEFDALKALGYLDEAKAFQAGEITGREYFSGLVQEIDRGLQSGKLTPQVAFDALGTKAEDLTLEMLPELDPAKVREEFKKVNVEGATADVADVLFGDLESSITEAQRLIETELAGAISDSFDIPGKIEQFNSGVKEFSRQIREGATIPQAIEVAFQIPGFADTVTRLESALGNLGIVLLEVAASILDAIGQGEAAAGVRATVTDAAAAQLAFDLKLNAGNEEAIISTVQTAINRGVEGSDLAKGVLTAGQELINAGDLDTAEAMITTLSSLTEVSLSPDVSAFFSGTGIDTTNLEAMKAALEDIQSTSSFLGSEVVSFGGLDPVNALNALESIDAATVAQTALQPLQDEFTKAQETATSSLGSIRSVAEEKLLGMEEIFVPVNEQTMVMYDAFAQADEALGLLGINSQTHTSLLATSLTTASGDVNDFSGNATTQFTEVVPLAVEAAKLSMQDFGTTVLNTMLKAGEDVQGLIDKLLSIGSLDLTVPGVSVGGGTSEGGGAGGGFEAGGQIPAGSVARVHAAETLYSGAQDVSVLNRQTSTVIDSAVAAYLAGAGMGGGNSSITNVTNNINIVNNGAAAAASTMNSAALRGF